MRTDWPRSRPTARRRPTARSVRRPVRPGQEPSKSRRSSQGCITGGGVERAIVSRPNHEDDEAVELSLDVKSGGMPETGFSSPRRSEPPLPRSDLGCSGRRDFFASSWRRTGSGSRSAIHTNRENWPPTSILTASSPSATTRRPTRSSDFDDQWFWRLDAVTPHSSMRSPRSKRGPRPGSTCRPALITFSKDRHYHPTNTELLVGIRVVSDGNHRDITKFGLDGRDL